MYFSLLSMTSIVLLHHFSFPVGEEIFRFSSSLIIPKTLYPFKYKSNMIFTFSACPTDSITEIIKSLSVLAVSNSSCFKYYTDSKCLQLIQRIQRFNGVSLKSTYIFLNNNVQFMRLAILQHSIEFFSGRTCFTGCDIRQEPLRCCRRYSG